MMQNEVLRNHGWGAELVAVSGVKNEIDIIESFVRHTLAFVDRLVVLDNGSTDGTSDVLRLLQEEGLALDVLNDPSTGKYQSRRTTRLMHEEAAIRLGAKWIVFLDADEFLVVAPGKPLVSPDADPTRPIIMPWRTYVPDERDDPNELNPVVRMQYRVVREATQRWKIIVPSSLAIRPDARVSSGSHDLFLGDERCDVVQSLHAHLAHLPIRSAGQFRSKVAINYLQYLSMPDRQPDWGWHYRDSFDLLKRDPKNFDATIAAVARDYLKLEGDTSVDEVTHDPLEYRGGPLRYSSKIDDEQRGWCSVLDQAAFFASRSSALSAMLDEDGELSLLRVAQVVSTLNNILIRLDDQQRQDQGALQRNREELFAIREKLLHAEHAQGLTSQELEACREQLRRHVEEIAASQRELQRRTEEMEGFRRDIFNRSEKIESHERELASCRQIIQKQGQELAQAQWERTRVEEAILAERQSWTWKTGRLVVGPINRLRRFARPGVRRARRLAARIRGQHKASAETIDQAARIILGSGETSYAGWFATDRWDLNVTDRKDFARHWLPNSRSGFLAEHVWEHLTPDESAVALAYCYEFLRPGGRIRLAVPDALHPDPAYQEWVKPGGVGPGADDHKQHYDYRTLSEQLKQAGFQVVMLEYWDEAGQFHRRPWNSVDGHVERSYLHDRRQREGIERYTSLIIDGIKPSAFSLTLARWRQDLGARRRGGSPHVHTHPASSSVQSRPGKRDESDAKGV